MDTIAALFTSLGSLCCSQFYIAMAKPINMTELTYSNEDAAAASLALLFTHTVASHMKLLERQR